MSGLSDRQVDEIAQRLAARLRGGGGATTAAVHEPAAARKSAAANESLGDGVFPDVDHAVEAAATAFRRLGEASLSLRESLVAAIRAVMLREGEALARHAWEETGLGRFEDKVIKNRLVTLKTPGPEALQPRTWTGDRGLTLTEWAPFGVIGAITPTT
ncbi:MAG: aldehyde dehydrogenase family protein, partial [bacterium]|nr:aldehyde dehydrogenase family protein [bacterium]